ncbi:hypothetical protein J7T55_013257 [Diaporthe amygdali]|uniref:uncharacterized protein n=1 Tax=Phomopsis amygdali TaxID=1214568 RepID=UPI0022FDE8ED|nr:uncharacterized protein J7T55_013257 [Diaporthe amygdali]KAJ0119022.1 hypothetical protein J7T55_013257 [Diaporthe amygdali]
MWTPFQEIIFNETTNDVGQFTADIDSALDKVESYNFSIKVSLAKKKQASQIAENLANQDYPAENRFTIEVKSLDRGIYNLENERQLVLARVDQAIRCLEMQRETANNLAGQVEGEEQENALIAVGKWDADIVYLQLRREVLGHSMQ